jgi:ADP-heptose:LPS heptosyltransferase
MGDLLINTPAFRALKETFGCKLTVLTSAMGGIITPYIPDIDATFVHTVPWVKAPGSEHTPEASLALITQLRQYNFDAAIIFTVYSQNPLPAAMLAMMAGIPRRLAYCRENPYDLLTDWVPDEEPYTFIRHQAERDLHLVNTIGANTNDLRLSVRYQPTALQSLQDKLQAQVNIHQPFLILHPGVSEEKRKYPPELWIATGKQLAEQYNLPLLITGSASEKALADNLQQGIGMGAVNVAGLLSIEEFIALVDQATAVVSVNTGTIHIAAATQTPVVVLYAQTNPQHTPWQVKHEVLPYSVPPSIASKNQVIVHVNKQLYSEHIPYPTPETIVAAVGRMLT